MADGGMRLDVDGVAKQYGGFTALDAVSLSVGQGELVSLLGPSGCGKTTLLRIVAGFVAQDRGSVRFDGRAVDGVPVRKRGIGIVFQSYALFPHMTVRQNVAYGLDALGWERGRKAARVEEMLALVQMAAFAGRRPAQLSGGQQQRVALARCLATGPRLLLLDEPFGALDKNLRLDMQIEVKRLQRTTGITTLMVTHDQEEALSMSDRIAVMNGGRIEQVGTPDDIYDRPATVFVNQFVGASNLLPGAVVDAQAVRLDGGAVLPVASGLGLGEPVWVSVRPERMRLLPGQADLPGALGGVVAAVLPLGPMVAYEFEAAGGARCKVVAPRAADEAPVPPGTPAAVMPASPAACRLFPRSAT